MSMVRCHTEVKVTGAVKLVRRLIARSTLNPTEAAHRHEAILREREVQLPRHGIQQQQRLTPCSIHLRPLDRYTWYPAQPQPVDSPKRSVVPDTERVVIHVGPL